MSGADRTRLFPMAEPRKLPFVTISSFGSDATASESKKRRREDEADSPVVKDGGGGGGGAAAAASSGGGGGDGGGGLFGNVKGGDTEPGERKPTVRLNLPLTEPNERGSAEFSYTELVQSTLTQVRRVEDGTKGPGVEGVLGISLQAECLRRARRPGSISKSH